jgi:hypothetical protein
MDNELEITPLDFFEAVMLNPSLPLPIRMKAATEAAKYRHPTMRAVAHSTTASQSFADALERAIARSQSPHVMNKEPKLIEQQSAEQLKGPMARLERRFG